MKQQYNKLSSAEHERLVLLMEECSEVQQIIGKILRHGYESYNPNDPQKRSNRKLLEKELGHVCFAYEFMNIQGDIDKQRIKDMMRLKNITVGKYLHHQEFNNN